MAKTAKKRDRARYQREYYQKRKKQRLAAEFQTPQPVTVNPEPDIAAAIEWIEATLRVPNGPLAGQPFRLPNWQREWLREAYRPEKRESGLSIARKNGKSGLIAAALLAHLCGPLCQTGWRAVVSSLTGPLARELRDAIEQTALVSGLRHQITIHKTPPPGRIGGLKNSRIDFLAADKATGHALGADLAIIDEAGLLPENKRPLWNALFSAISGRNGRFWGISIQAEGPMFAELEKRAESPTVHWRKWTSPITCELDDESAWLASNPGIADGIKAPEYMRDAAARAASSPGNEAHFRAYDLNQPVDPEREMIVSVGDYAKCIAPDAPLPAGDLIVGVDLGGAVSMTCAVAYSPSNGGILCRGAFGDDPPLMQRAKIDQMGTLYDRMRREGELRVYDGRVTPVVPFLSDVFEEFGALGRIVGIGADRYRRAEAEAAFRDAGLPPGRSYWRGQGAAAAADGSHDVRCFQKAILKRRLKTRGSTMLEAAIASSVLRYDGAGNPALDKRNNNSRIDCLSAAVIACGVGDLLPDAPLLRVSVV